MTDLRILLKSSGESFYFRGSGFLLTGGVAITVHHVVRGCETSGLHVQTADGRYAGVTAVASEVGIDATVLSLDPTPVSRDYAGKPASGSWLVSSRPRDNDPQLNGTVAATERIVVNASGHVVSALQLRVAEDMDDFAGYSGSAVRDSAHPSCVLGMLVEQVHSRLSSPGVGKRATNVLYAIPIETILEAFGLEGTARGAAAYGAELRDISGLIDNESVDAAERRLAKLPTTVRASPTFWYLRARAALCRTNLPVAVAYLDEAFKVDKRHASSVALKVYVLLLLNGPERRVEAKRLAEHLNGLDRRIDQWLSCLRSNRLFDADFVSATTLDTSCPAEWMRHIDPCHHGGDARAWR